MLGKRTISSGWKRCKNIGAYFLSSMRMGQFPLRFHFWIAAKNVASSGTRIMRLTVGMLSRRMAVRRPILTGQGSCLADGGS